MVFIARRWRYPKVIIGFFLAEFALTIPALVLFALADPDEFRTLLWEDGFLNGFNSNPKQVLYQAANYEPVHIPLVWSPFITNWNVVISVLSMFFLLVKGIMFVMHIWIPLISFLIHGGIAAVWAYSIYGQTGSDMSDPKQPQPGAPWYITKSCSVAHFESNIRFCKQAKASLAISVLMLTVFAANTFFAAFCMYPSAKEREERALERAEDEEDDGSEFDPDIGIIHKDANGSHSDDNSFEMEQIAARRGIGNRHGTVSMQPVKSPVYPPPAGRVTGTAMTPRTTAFHRLAGR